MKIRLLFFALVLLLKANFISAQTKKLQIGLEGGPSLTSIDGKERFTNNQNSKVGFAGGISFQYDFSKIFSLRTGIGFERKGYKSRYTSYVYDGQNHLTLVDFGENRFNFDYLTVPILARVSSGRKINLFANAGPYFAYLLNFTDTKDLYKNSIVSWKDFYKRFDWGIAAGIGGAVPLNDNLLLTLEARYNLGLFNNLKGNSYYSYKNYNNSASLLMGIAYKF